MSDFLPRILASRRAAVHALRRTIEPDRLAGLACARPSPRDFAAALHAPGMSLVAELKRASPSRGPIAPGVDVRAQARAYAAGGAAALSVLTEPEFFQGSPDDVATAREASGLPVMWKDFVIDRIQVHQARAKDADAVLVIVRILEDEAMRTIVDQIRAYRMTPVVEVFDERDLERALALDGVEVVGVNNRDLESFEEDPHRTAKLRPLIPDDVVAAAFSSISTRADVVALEAIGVDAVLVGEALMRAPDPAVKVQELLGR